MTGPTEAPAAVCPSCGFDGEGHVRDSDGIRTGYYLCPAGHIWQTRWADLGVTA